MAFVPRTMAAWTTLVAFLLVALLRAAPAAAFTTANVPDPSGDFVTHYYTTTCASTGQQMVFLGGTGLSGVYVYNITAVADSGLDGGMRMMASFRSSDGLNFEDWQGFDPCKHTTCAGVTCANPSYVITQEYVRPVEYFLANNTRLSFPKVQSSMTTGDDRCSCRDPLSNYAVATPNSVIISPTSPSAEKDSMVCLNYTCTLADGVTIDSDYYIYSNSTEDGCECCERQSTVLVPRQSNAVCGNLAPTVKWFALAESPHNYMPFTCNANGTTWTQYNRCTSSDGINCYGDYFTSLSGVSTDPATGYDVCNNAECVGWYCDPGYVLLQNYAANGYANSPAAFTYNHLFAPAGDLDVYNGACYCAPLTPNGLITPGFYQGNAVQGGALHVYEGGLNYRYDDDSCVANGYVCKDPAQQNLYLDSGSGTCYCCHHRDQPFYYHPIVPTDPAMCYQAAFSLSSYSSSSSSSLPSSRTGSSGSSSSSAASANALYSFVSNACPAGTLNSVLPSDVHANRNALCCDYTATNNVASSVTTYCGGALTSLPQAEASLHCTSSIPNTQFECCAKISSTGVISNVGRSCPAGGGDAAASLTPLSVATVLTTAVALLAALC